MTWMKQTASVVGLLILQSGLSNSHLQAQALPEVLVEVRIESPNYLNAGIDITSLDDELTSVASGALNRVGDFGFISFRPSDSTDTSGHLPRAEFKLSERNLSSSHQHWLSMFWHPGDSTSGTQTVFEEMIFGAIDEHHSDDADLLRAALTDTLEYVLSHARFTGLMMEHSFATITLARSVVPDSAQIVHIPISQSLLHASRESSFEALFSHPQDFTRSGSLRMKVAFPADMFPGSPRTACVASAFQFPIGNDVAEADQAARWRDVVRVLTEEPGVIVNVKMLKYVPEGIRGVTNDGVIVAGGSP